MKMYSYLDTFFNIPTVQLVCDQFNHTIQDVNQYLSIYQPVYIITVSVLITFTLKWLFDLLFGDHLYSLHVRFKKMCFSLIRRLPPVQKFVNKKILEASTDLENSFNANVGPNFPYRTILPEKGIDKQELLTLMNKYKKMEVDGWEDGLVSGAVYTNSSDLTGLMTQVFSEFAWTNPLHLSIFPDIRRMEAEVVRMCCNLYHGGPKTCGTMTSGGTESIMLACKTYRDVAYQRGIKYPEIIVPLSAHAAFDKAAEYFRMKLTKIPLDPVTRKVEIAAMRRKINKNTCMLVGSAPSYPYGIVDPIKEISELGLKYKVPVHVDACLGGFLLPFMEAAGFTEVEPCDFRLPGVTSISCDTHKYGYAVKGSSVIMYSDPKYRDNQIFVAPDFLGGIYASPTFAGSRPGVIIAGCWATMMYMGFEGYVSCTKSVVSTAAKIAKGINSIPGLYTMGKPEMSLVAVGSDKINIYALNERLLKRGWNLVFLQYPPSFHLCVTMLHTKSGVAEKFLQDVQEIAEDIYNNPQIKCEGYGVLYGMASAIPDRSMVTDIATAVIASCYSTNTPSVDSSQHESLGNGTASRHTLKND